MKLLQEFKNEYNNITYRLYELDCGIKLIHLENPATVNFDFFSVHKAGNIYEEIEKVPHGSAHLMEHMLLNPNTRFKTRDEIHKFQEGDKTRPGLEINAGTWYKYIDLRGSSNEKGTNRVIERIESMLDFPYEKFKRSLVNEKRIVTAERSRQLQMKKDNFIQKLIFLEGKDFPEFTYNRIGEVNEIKNIDIKDLQIYFNNRFISKGAVFGIQSKKVLDQPLIDKLERMGSKYSTYEAPLFPKHDLNNKLAYGYFYDEKATGLTLDINYFDTTTNGIDYKKESIDRVLNSVIRRIGFLLLREKKGLIYGLQVFNEDWFNMYHSTLCFRFVVENSRVDEMVKSLDPFFFKDIEKFIKSEKGTRWINNIISDYIYPSTIVYDQKLPQIEVMNFIEYGEMYNQNMYKTAIKNITKKDLLKRLRYLQSTPPHIWVESNLPKKEIEKIVKSSSLWKRFK